MAAIFIESTQAWVIASLTLTLMRVLLRLVSDTGHIQVLVDTTGLIHGQSWRVWEFAIHAAKLVSDLRQKTLIICHDRLHLAHWHLMLVHRVGCIDRGLHVGDVLFPRRLYCQVLLMLNEVKMALDLVVSALSLFKLLRRVWSVHM